jgi:hypothetical protein
MIYVVSMAAVSRVHRGSILTDVGLLVDAAVKAIKILVTAWPVARMDVIPVPALVKVEDVIPGFFRHMLTARKGELVGVLPGRTESHVAKLAMVYGDERRNHTDVTRADLAQAVTRYIKDQPAPVRHPAERAIGTWLVDREPVSYLAA